MKDFRDPKVQRFLVAVALSALGGGLSLPIILIYQTQVRGLAISSAMLLLSANALLGLFLSPLVGTLVDHFGPRKILLISTLIEAAGVYAWSYMHTFRDAALISVVVSIGNSGMWPPQAAMMSRMVSEEARQKFFGLQFMMLNLGLGIGGIIGSSMVSIDNPASFSRVFALDAFSFVAYFFIVLSLRGVGGRLTAEEKGTESNGSWREVLSNRVAVRYCVTVTLMMVCGYASIDGALPILLTKFSNVSVNDLGKLWAINTFVIVTGQLFVNKLITGHSRMKLVTFVCGLWAIAWIFNGLSVARSTTIALVFAGISMAIFAIGEMIWSPVGPSVINDLAPEHLRGRYNSLNSLIWVVSGAIGPALSGAFLQREMPIEWVGLLIIGLGITAVGALRLRPFLTPAQDGYLPTGSGN